DYEIVSPYEVTHQGQYISHEVSHHHRRGRRSLTPDTSSTDETIHFRLNGLGQEFHMELRETSGGLIAPGFTIQVLGKNGTKSLRAYQKHDLCFYQGSLRSRVNSSVALSTCTGMVSLIRTPDADYILRPLSRDLAQKENFMAPSSHQPHILYKWSEQKGPGPRARWKRSVNSSRHTSPQASGNEDQENQQQQRGDILNDRLEHYGAGHRHGSDYSHGERQRQHFCGRRKKCM
ncbi:unnamed protein product, partial [Tetraodon nigroviridis]